jgi:hypothetical protein
MKYMFLFVNNSDEVEAFLSAPETVRNEGFERVNTWAKKYGSKKVAGEALMPAEAATTVRFTDGFGKAETAIVTDGPYAESKEVIGGFWVVDVADLDEALKMAKEWPGSRLVEVRPVHEIPAR